LPQSVSSGCAFDTPILPDPEASAVAYYSKCFSLPKWLIASWEAEYGLEKAVQICFASNRRPSIYVRVNHLKVSTDEFVERLRTADVECELVGERMVQLRGPALVSRLPGFGEGLFSVQDLTASRPVELLAPKPGERILDLCSAPGTKTSQLAELSGGKGEIVATDLDEKRLRMVRDTVSRLGLENVQVVPYADPLELGERFGGFDGVLLDVPCSNTGVLARRPELRYRIKRAAIEGLRRTQGQLLVKAAQITRPGGRICYSTCSIQGAENGLLVQDLLQMNRNLTMVEEELTLPAPGQVDHDGGYAAVVSRSAEGVET
jgi:16S rRNA (cytosine967-C5)-methyltransferase